MQTGLPRTTIVERCAQSAMTEYAALLHGVAAERGLDWVARSRHPRDAPETLPIQDGPLLAEYYSCRTPAAVMQEKFRALRQESLDLGAHVGVKGPSIIEFR
eukprot:8645616-Pyramimonas_sp.AAC.1